MGRGKGNTSWRLFLCLPLTLRTTARFLHTPNENNSSQLRLWGTGEQNSKKTNEPNCIINK